MSGKWLWQESKDEWHSSGIGATPGKSQANTKRKNNHLLIEQCISLYWAMESLSLYIIKQCLLLTNIAMPVALYVSIATLATFFVPNLYWRYISRNFSRNLSQPQYGISWDNFYRSSSSSLLVESSSSSLNWLLSQLTHSSPQEHASVQWSSFLTQEHLQVSHFPLQPQHTSSITDSRAGARSVQLISSASPLTHHPWPSGPWFRILASNACFQT